MTVQAGGESNIELAELKSNNNQSHSSNSLQMSSNFGKASQPNRKGTGKGRRGKRSSAIHKQNKPKDERGGSTLARDRALLGSWLGRAVIHRTTDFTILEDCPHTSTGWHGRAPHCDDRDEIIAAYRDGSLNEVLKTFYQVPYVQ